MLHFPETELILTTEKKVYHLNIRGEDIADDVVLVGDPGRVKTVSDFFQSVDFKTFHREFITHTGTFNGKKLSVISTGIGTDNIDIVLNELDAAVNIDPHSRALNKQRRTLNIVRLGTSGALQAEIPIDGFVASNYGLGLDGLLNYYEGLSGINENLISEAFQKHAAWPDTLAFPYCIKGSDILLEKISDGHHKGITATAPGFYGPQGREIRLKCALPHLNELLKSFKFNDQQILNFEMETSALYGLGKLLGHECATLCVIIANRVRHEFTMDYEKSVKKLIEYSLNKLTS